MIEIKLLKIARDAFTLPMNSRIFSGMIPNCWLVSGLSRSDSETLLFMMSCRRPYGPSRRRRIVSTPRLSTPPDNTGIRLPKTVAVSAAPKFVVSPESLDLRPHTSNLPPNSKTSEYRLPLITLESRIPAGIAGSSLSTLRASLALDKPKSLDDEVGVVPRKLLKTHLH